jgi:hypothetical protein
LPVHSARSNNRYRWLPRLIFVAALFALPVPHPALAQTVIDEPQFVKGTPRNGVSSGGAYSCSISGVPAGATVGACIIIGNGSSTVPSAPTITETSQGATVNDRKHVDSSANYNDVDQVDIVNAAGDTYTFKSVSGSGNIPQTIIPYYLTGVTTTPFDQTGSSTNSTSTTFTGAQTASTLADVTEIAVECFGTNHGTGESSFTSPSAAAWTIQGTESSVPAGASVSVVTSSTAQLTGTNIAAASSATNISTIATYISSVQPTITPHGTPTTTAFSSSTGGTVNLPSGISTNDCIAITCCGAGVMSSPSLSGGGNTYTKELGPTSFDSNGASMTTWFGQETASATNPTVAFGVSLTGVCGAAAFSGANGCTDDGTPTANTSASSPLRAPSDTGAQAGDAVMLPTCWVTTAGDTLTNPEPMLDIQGYLGLESTTELLGDSYYPITVTATMPGQERTLSGSYSAGAAA